MARERLSFIWDAFYKAPRSANPLTSGGPPSVVSLFGISARKVYPNVLLPSQCVGSYPTFSPLPYNVTIKRRLFSVALAVSTGCGPFPLRSMAPCIAPTFLLRNNSQATEHIDFPFFKELIRDKDNAKIRPWV